MANATPHKIIAIPSKGLWLDSLESQMPEGFYGEAWNMVTETDEESNFGIANEAANEIFLLLPTGFDLRGLHSLPDRDQVVVFIYNEASDFSEIGLVDLANKVYIQKINDATLGGKLGFSSDRWIHSTSKSMDLCNDRWVYFSAKQVYRFFNIDSRLLHELTLNDTRLFLCYATPAPRARKRDVPGSNLPNGVYQYVARLQDDDQNETNWFNVSNPISLASPKAEPGEFSGQAVDVRVVFAGNHLFDRIVLAVIKTISGKTLDPEILVETSYSPGGFSFLHFSEEQGTGKFVPLIDVIAKKDQYLKGDNLMTHDGRLILYNLVSPFNLDMQRLANEVEVSWGKHAAPAEDSAEIRGLMGGETIAIAIRPNYCDGTKGAPFHLPGRAKEPEDVGPVFGDDCAECPLEKWQVEDTSYVTRTYCDILPNWMSKVTERGNGGGGNSGGGSAVADPGTGGTSSLDIFGKLTYTRPEAILTVYEDPPCNFCGRKVPLNWAAQNWGVYMSHQIDPTGPANKTFEIDFEFGAGGDATEPISDLLGLEATGKASYTMDAPGGPGQDTATCYKCRNWLKDSTVTAEGCIGPGCPCSDPSNQTPRNCPSISAGMRVRRVKYSAAQGNGSLCSGGSCGGSCGGGSACAGNTAGGSGCAGGKCGGSVNDGLTAESTSESTGGGSGTGGGGLNPDSTVGQDQGTGSCSGGNCGGSGTNAGGCSTINTSADCGGPRYKGAEIDDVLDHCGEAIGFMTRLKERLSSVKGPGMEIRDKLYSGEVYGGTDAFKVKKTRVLGGCEVTNVYDETGCFVVDKEYPVVQEGRMGYWESTILYPDTKDCDGNFIYGELAGTPVRHHKVPSRRFHPHVNANQQGVVNRFAPGNIETSETDYFHFGLILRNIKLPDNPPKPYAKENPFTIMIMPITEKNRSVLAKGIAPGTFMGQVNDETYSIPRNGINSLEFFDRHIQPANDALKEIRGGEINDVPGYMFYSPDALFDKPFLNADRVNVELALLGKGYRYGQYAEGEEPVSAWVPRTNQRGTRQAINLNQAMAPVKAGSFPAYINSSVQDHRCLRGATFVPGDSVVDHGIKLRRSVLNLRREKGAYFELEDINDTILNQQQMSPSVRFDNWLSDNNYNGIPGGNLTANRTADASFMGDGVDFEGPIHYAEAPYVALTRRIPDQYGGVEVAAYESLYEGTPQDLEEGRCWFLRGDTYIHNFTFRRTAYVSENIGEKINPEADSFSWLGFAGDCGEMPQEEGMVGCDADPRVCNNLRGHTVSGPQRRIWDGSSSFPGFTNPYTNTSDSRLYTLYFPGTVKTLVNFPVETRINLAHRQYGNELDNGEAVSEKLEALKRDSNAPYQNTPWKDGWLNRFYVEMPEIKLLNKIFRFIFNVILISLLSLLGLFVIIAMILDTIMMIVKLIIWVIDQFLSSSGLDPIGGDFGNYELGNMSDQAFKLLAEMSSTDARMAVIDSILGITQCIPDHARGGNDKWLRQWEDNYFKYDFTHSMGNRIEPAYGIPSNYYVCKCAPYTYNNKAVYSNKQVVNSPVDSWRNFKINNYVQVPPELGEVTKIFSMGNQLYIHTTDGLINAHSSGGRLEVGDDSVYLGRGDLFNVSAPIYGGVIEGVAGLKDNNSAYETRFGYVFPDRESRTFYLFDGAVPKAVSNQGVKHFLRNNGHLELLDHFPDFDIVDQKSKHGIGYSIGIDNGRNRIVFSKIDFAPKEGVTLVLAADKKSFVGVKLGDPAFFEDKSFTLTYNPVDGAWESFHNYRSLVYFWDRFKLWSFSSERMLLHNIKGKFQEFDGVFYPASVDIHMKEPQTYDTFEVESVTLDTEASRWNGCQYVKGLEETFNEGLFWNHFHSTDQLPLVWDQSEKALTNTKYKSGLIPIEYNYRRWNIAAFMDRVKNQKEPTFLCRTSFGPAEPNKGNLEIHPDVALAHTKNHKFVDNHLSMRLVFSKFTDVKLVLKYITGLVRYKGR